jgi:hypothetical protein
MGRTAVDPLIRYQAKVDCRGPDECWPWTAARFERGYGAFRLGDKQKKAHRVGYELLVGPIPSGQNVCHTCDNPPCQNPAHWFLGTHADNARDRQQKGRGAAGSPLPTGHKRSTGERNSNAKLTEKDVRVIRALCRAGRTQQSVAAQYGLTQSAVGYIVRRKLWAHVA